MTDEELIALADRLDAWRRSEFGQSPPGYMFEEAAAAIRAMIAAREQGWREGVEAAARYIQDEYPHDKRALVPAIRTLVAERGK